MVLMVFVTMTHALTGSMITHFEKMRARREADALEEYTKAKGRLTVCSTGKVKAKNDFTPMAKGKLLKPSIAGNPSEGGTFPQDPWTCTHTGSQPLAARGGRGGQKWFTCLECGSRWERLTATETPVPPGLSGSAASASNPQVQAPSGSPLHHWEQGMMPWMSGDGSSVRTTMDPRLQEIYHSYLWVSEDMTHTKAIQQMLLNCQNDQEMTVVMEFGRLQDEKNRLRTMESSK
jgi:hypothetical protein